MKRGRLGAPSSRVCREIGRAPGGTRGPTVWSPTTDNSGCAVAVRRGRHGGTRVLIRDEISCGPRRSGPDRRCRATRLVRRRPLLLVPASRATGAGSGPPHRGPALGGRPSRRRQPRRNTLPGRRAAPRRTGSPGGRDRCRSGDLALLRPILRVPHSVASDLVRAHFPWSWALFNSALIHRVRADPGSFASKARPTRVQRASCDLLARTTQRRRVARPRKRHWTSPLTRRLPPLTVVADA